MMAAWMVDTLVASVLIGLSALLLERGARGYRMPTRFLWIGAMLASVLLPLVARWNPGGILPAGSLADNLLAGLPSPSGWTAAATLDGGDATGWSVTAWVLALWAIASGVIGLVFATAVVRLRRERALWSSGQVAGVQVFFSTAFGPAVVGILDSRIVMPTWVLRLNRRIRRLIVLHEAQHLRAGDVRTLTLATVLVVLMPWNVALWWQLRRLRFAVEVDCDRRVLRTSVQLRDYAELLISMRGRRRWMPVPALAFARPPSTLARRIDVMTNLSVCRHPLRSVGYAAVAGALFVLACDASAPGEPEAPVLSKEAAAGSALHEIAELASDARIAREAVVARKRAFLREDLVALKMSESAEEADSNAPVETVVLVRTAELRPTPAPLYVVDGIIVGAGMLDIDTLRIEMIEVVKGAAAEARFGDRAKNGVVLITTKKHD